LEDALRFGKSLQHFPCVRLCIDEAARHAARIPRGTRHHTTHADLIPVSLQRK
jgi:hypothetical protein